jgi:hypothetical protein
VTERERRLDASDERQAKRWDLLEQGLGPFIERELTNAYKDQARAQAARLMGEERLLADEPLARWDAAARLKLMWEACNDVFRKRSDLRSERSCESSRTRATTTGTRGPGSPQPRCFFKKSTVRSQASLALLGSCLDGSVERMKAWPAS